MFVYNECLDENFSGMFSVKHYVIQNID